MDHPFEALVRSERPTLTKRKDFHPSDFPEIDNGRIVIKEAQLWVDELEKLIVTSDRFNKLPDKLNKLTGFLYRIADEYKLPATDLVAIRGLFAHRRRISTTTISYR